MIFFFLLDVFVLWFHWPLSHNINKIVMLYGLNWDPNSLFYCNLLSTVARCNCALMWNYHIKWFFHKNASHYCLIFYVVYFKLLTLKCILRRMRTYLNWLLTAYLLFTAEWRTRPMICNLPCVSWANLKSEGVLTHPLGLMTKCILQLAAKSWHILVIHSKESSHCWSQ